jgi:hypothetical protein
MIRYPWYAATLMQDCPNWLTWLRYTAFIPLYPIGVIAEMVLLYVSRVVHQSWGVTNTSSTGVTRVDVLMGAWYARIIHPLCNATHAVCEAQAGKQPSSCSGWLNRLDEVMCIDYVAVGREMKLKCQALCFIRHPAFRRYTFGSPVLLGRVPCPPLQSGLTWLGVLLSDLSWLYPGGQCHSCCGERAHV